ncbi:MAG TPA: winged helix-turn-helix transcriptional regulator [Dehalococcoidia bacterium]|nr:winged helix-turn-helix transcriptional regulator [Dehalococcoidia bacterium]
MSPRDLQTGRLLAAIASDDAPSQRELARRAGIALGLTNHIIRQLAARGWIRIVRKANRRRYVMTPQGAAAHDHLARAHLQDNLVWYAEARNRIRTRLRALSSDWIASPGAHEHKPVVFYGAGDVAEIAYVCLLQTDLTLVGVVDETRIEPFFGRGVRPLSALGPDVLDGAAFERVIVTSFDDGGPIVSKLRDRGCSSDRLFWL